MDKIYLDHSATTPVDPEVVRAMLPFFTETFGNPSSIHRFGQEARMAVEHVRERIASALGARADEIHFVSGGTEADNLAIKGIAYARQNQGKHIITDKAEHKAVLETCRALQSAGFDVTYLDVDQFGMVHPGAVEDAIRKDTILISIMHANNEVGTINPITEIGQIARSHKIAFHTDAVQTFSKTQIDVNEMNIDLLSLSGHKIYAPKGIGALFIRRGSPVSKQMHGGSHERNRRAGTENVPAIIGLGKACQIAAKNRSALEKQIHALGEYLYAGIKQHIDGVTLNGHPTDRIYNILNLSFDGSEADALLMGLDMAGIAASAGSACTSGSLEHSHVLKAMGVPSSRIQSAIRFSFGKGNTQEELDYTIEQLKKIVKRQRAVRR
jgi:cysteine desulfurase